MPVFDLHKSEIITLYEYNVFIIECIHSPVDGHLGDFQLLYIYIVV